jgi:cyclophilin family peptidyl-prolyl cis-trans isomerase
VPRLLVSVAVALGLALSGCGEEESQSGSSGGTPPPPKRAERQSPGAQGGCRAVAQPQPKPEGGAKAPKKKLKAKEATLSVRTNCGTFDIRLDVEAAPETAASLVSLAEDDFFDKTFFHRIVPGFVIQGGDPTGTGTGGPGYKTKDKPPKDARYTKGVVAMAKTESEAPGTAGSQFYVVTGADAGLPPDYAIVGEVSKGLDVVERIGRLGDPATEMPTQPVVIEDVAVAS